MDNQHVSPNKQPKGVNEMKSIFDVIHGSITLEEAPPLYAQLNNADFRKTVAPFITKSYIRRIAKMVGVEVDAIRVGDALAWDRFFIHYKGLMMPLHDMRLSTLESMSTVKAFNLQKESIDQLLYENDFELYLGRVDKRLRLYTFSKMYNRIPAKDLMSCFEYVHTSAEGRYGLISEGVLYNVHMRLSKRPEYRRRMQELEPFLNEDGTLTIYRGCQGNQLDDADERTRSWTTDKAVAEFFAERFSEDNEYPGHVKQLVVKPTEVMFYLTGRGEDEVLLKRGGTN